MYDTIIIIFIDIYNITIYHNMLNACIITNKVIQEICKAWVHLYTLSMIVILKIHEVLATEQSYLSDY